MKDRPERRETITRLARVVQSTTETAAAIASSGHREQHRTTNWLRDVILGGQDGLVNILGIILGVIAGGGSNTVLLAAGFAAAITESISMGAVGYTSTVSERDYYQAERARESAEIDTVPEVERQEIRDIYSRKGFSGDLLERVVDTITANRDRWLETMMGEELRLQPVKSADILAQCDRDHDRNAGRAPAAAHSLCYPAADAGPGSRDRRERDRVVRCGRLFGGNVGRRLAQERSEDDRDRPGRGRSRLPRRPPLPLLGRLTSSLKQTLGCRSSCGDPPFTSQAV